jgi:ABC-type transport system involved in multi-copper enzyme maturation permease subunit
MEQPIQGYRPRSRTYRIFAITREEIKIAFKNPWARLCILFAYVTVSGYLFINYLLASTQKLQKFIAPQGGIALCRDQLNNGFIIALAAVLTAVIGGPLISRDIRLGGITMYFSKSITRFDYLLGKFLALLIYLGSVTFLPAFILQLGLITLSPLGISLWQHLLNTISILAHSLIIIIPSCAMILAFSSFSKSPYPSSILWLFIFLGGNVASDLTYLLTQKEWSKMISLMNNFRYVGSYLYNLDPSRRIFDPLGEIELMGIDPLRLMDLPLWQPALVLIGITLLSGLVVLRRLRYLEATA